MNRYSKNAMPQLARMTSQSGELLNFGFKLPYHANVMKMFEQVSSTMGSQRDDVISMPQKMNSPAVRVKCEWFPGTSATARAFFAANRFSSASAGFSATLAAISEVLPQIHFLQPWIWKPLPPFWE